MTSVPAFQPAQPSARSVFKKNNLKTLSSSHCVRLPSGAVTVTGAVTPLLTFVASASLSTALQLLLAPQQQGGQQQQQGGQQQPQLPSVLGGAGTLSGRYKVVGARN